MKTIFTACCFILCANFAFSQCVIEHWSLEKRIDQSELVVEGQVIDQICSWDKQHKNIYTINTIELYKSFKGSLSTDQIEVVSMGGQIGLQRHEAFPSMQFEIGQKGIFLLTNSPIEIDEHTKLFFPTATTESFIVYDEVEVMAYDVEKSYYSIVHDLYNDILVHSGDEITEIKTYDPEHNEKVITPLAVPTVDSISLDTVSSGTAALLTIYGSNFGPVRSTGSVGFKDANFGDGRHYYPPVSASYKSWNNSKIEVYVPTRAGTGKIQVVTSTSHSDQSPTELYVKWAHTNVLYGTASVDTNFYPNQHYDHNGSGGYTWQMTDNFASKEDPLKSFYRSLETWRCATFMNWKVGSDTSLDQTADDDVNIVRFDDLTGNKLGTCWSRWGGCFNGTANTFYWYVSELDIEFDSTYNWYYGTGTPGGSQMDFQSVATHELGHGHQLSHVRDDTKTMHYSIGAGDRKASLSFFDIQGGEFVMDASTGTSHCSKTKMTALTSGNCQTTLPVVSFGIDDTTVCQGDDVVYTNQTDGNGLTFSWDFGVDASTSTASTEGPHTISYSSSGTKTIKLVVENNFGKDSMSRIIEVLPPKPNRPAKFLESDTGCIGEVTYTIDEVNFATGYAWAVSSGGSFVGGSTGKSVTVDWTTSGDKTVTVVSLGECGNSAGRVENVYIQDDAVALFSESPDGLVVDFSSSSTDATTHLWDFGDGASSSQKNPTHQYADQGDYDVKLKVTNQCSADSLEKSVSVTFKVGIDELELLEWVSPNPAKSGQLINLSSNVVEAYEIIDMNGRIISEGQLLSNQLLLPKLSDGIYVIRLKQFDNVTERKLLIRNE
ncbi:MAG: PKD domain-containing protein [Bacteroidia bacterium]